MTGSEYAKQIGKSPGSARRALFDEYYKYVCTIVCSKLSSAASREDIEECVSDIFAEVFFCLDEKSGYSGDLKGLISTIAKRRAIDRFRGLAANKLSFLSIEGDELYDIRDDYDLETQAENEQQCALLLDKINELGEPDSTIIIQRYYFGRSSREIAESLSMKPSAVRMRCARALKRLRSVLAEFEEN